MQSLHFVGAILPAVCPHPERGREEKILSKRWRLITYRAA